MLLLTTLWKMIWLSTVMLVAGYVGESIDPANAQLWGLLAGLAYFWVVYEIWLGGASKLAASAGGAGPVGRIPAGYGDPAG